MIIQNRKGDSQEITIRMARSDEASKLIALITKQHGKNYPDPHLYQEEVVYESIKNGSLYFAVVECTDGSLEGMTAAGSMEIFPGSMIFKLLIINPRLRGFGLGKHLHQFLLQTLPIDTYTAIYTYCLTLDTISQTICSDLGYQMTGLLLNRYIYDVQAENLAGLSLPLKRIHLVAALPRSKKDAGTLYMPPEYAPYITGVYESLDVRYRAGTPVESSPAQSTLTVTCSEIHRYCEVIVQQGGLDFGDQLRNILDRYGALEQQTFNAFINLNDPGSLLVCRILEEQGFYFTGLQPLSGEYMLFHYSPNTAVPFNQIAIAPAYRERFLWIQQRRREVRYVED